ncbi:hypothetical protein [Natrinema longum]|uniref:Uncharacterized protein n=1 Tax=Natrinema longum TaxID=370324 RepID=A0A8A2UAV5_9EURY|nr:hypothetical protein [Natrinema longum]MBZ6496133.1 hypothetical protein [Natrinema longum]QSW85941.1 hypothetical protein J0X27_03655 [Natrinema longum]
MRSQVDPRERDQSGEEGDRFERKRLRATGDERDRAVVDPKHLLDEFADDVF